MMIFGGADRRAALQHHRTIRKLVLIDGGSGEIFCKKLRHRLDAADYFFANFAYMRTKQIVALAGVGLALLGWIFFGIVPDSDSRKGTVRVEVPELSRSAMSGKVAFDANCAQCHGVNGGGTGKGPPLIHDIYNPGHHSDASFFSAVRQGVPQHHWPFGNMPPQPQVTNEQVAEIVMYVREVQVANGIVNRQHRMPSSN